MRRWAAIVAIVVAASCTGAGGPPGPPPTPSTSPSSGPPVVARACERPTLIGRVRHRGVVVRSRPSAGAPARERFRRVNPQGAVQVFPLLDTASDGGSTWYRALLPMRPNGATGWIAGDRLRLERSDYRIVIDLGRFRLSLFHLCQLVSTYPIGYGTKDTPTPRGTFFLNSLLRPPARGSVYGAYAYGLSAYSNVIRDWAGGGIVGLHGTNDPSSVGRRVSHGCIRMRNGDIRALVKVLPLGTLVTIR